MQAFDSIEMTCAVCKEKNSYTARGYTQLFDGVEKIVEFKLNDANFVLAQSQILRFVCKKCGALI